MRFGVIFSMQDPPGSPLGHQALYTAALEQAVDAERSGYDWINVTEHHVAADGYLPALFVMLAAIAASTQHIRLSTGMLILTLHDPIRIAEEAAVLDLISCGRLTLGVAVGYREHEFEVFGVDYRTRGRRFEESIEIIELAWAGEDFSYRGEVFNLPRVSVRPLPAQRPGIPLWIGGTSEPALRRAARLSAACFPGATATLAEVAAARASFDRHRAEAGLPDNTSLIVPRLALVADSLTEARRLAHPAITAMFETYQSWGVPIDFAGILRDWEALDELVIVGDESYCAAQRERYAVQGVTDLMLQFALPTIPPSLAAESQARFMAACTV